MLIARFKKWSLVFLLILTAQPLFAKSGHPEFGPVIGFALPFDRVAGKTASGPGVIAGLTGLYLFDEGDFRNLSLEYGVDYSLGTNLVFENTNGTPGRFKEDIGILSFGGGIRYFLNSGLISPFVGLRPGFYFGNAFSTSLRDRFGNPLPDPGGRKHFNFGFRIPLGVSWRPTFRWDLGLGIQIDLMIRNSGIVPGLSFPLSVRMSF